MKFIRVYEFDTEYQRFKKTTTQIKIENIIKIRDITDKEFCEVVTKNKSVNYKLLCSFIISLVIDIIFAIVCCNRARVYSGFYLFCGIASMLMFMLIPYGHRYSTYYVAKTSLKDLEM